MISFIIIGKNEGERLVKAIMSIHSFVKEEGIKSYELIYVDSKSTDKSIENAILNGVDKVFQIQGTCNAAIGRNIGAKEASGDILFFLDGDMELIPGLYKEIVNSDGRLVYPFVSGIEEDVLYDNDWNYITSQLRRKFKEGEDAYEKTTGGLFCIDGKLWKEAGGMDPRQKKSEDLDLGYRLFAKGYPLCRKGRVWVRHHTRFYAVRPENEDGVNYTALLVRKHLCRPLVQWSMFSSTYSYWLLLCCLVLAFFIPFWIPLALYFAVVAYRSMRIIQKTNIRLNPITIFWRRMKKDFRFWWAFLTFWPPMPKIEYIEVKKN